MMGISDLDQQQYLIYFPWSKVCLLHVIKIYNAVLTQTKGGENIMSLAEVQMKKPCSH